jgi:large subunit ribosomal protein L1
MSKRTRLIHKKVDLKKNYSSEEAFNLLKNHSSVKFIESVDAAINLGTDPRKSDQNVRGVVMLPHGIGRKVRVAVFTQEVESAKKAGADRVGLEDLAEEIRKGSINFDVVIASPEAMPTVGKLGQILGPRGLMPNPKFGTITPNISEAITKAKKGQIQYRNDKNGIVHSTIGRINFDIAHLKENLQTLITTLNKAKPNSSKGMYIKKLSVSTTMGFGITMEQSGLI